MMPGKVIGGLHIASGNTVSIVLDTSHPEIQAFLQPIIQDSWSRYLSSNPVPEPTGALGSFAFLGAAALRRTRREQFTDRVTGSDQQPYRRLCLPQHHKSPPTPFPPF